MASNDADTTMPAQPSTEDESQVVAVSQTNLDYSIRQVESTRSILLGFVSIFFHLELPSLLLKDPFRFRPNNKTKASLSDGDKKIFTYHLAPSLGVARTGNQAVVNKRIVEFLVNNPDMTPTDVKEAIIKSKKGKAFESAIKKDADMCEDFLLIEHADDGIASDIPDKVLELFFRWDRLGLAPNDNIVHCLGKKIKLEAIVEAMEYMDIADDAQEDDGSVEEVINKRTTACMLRLLVLLIVDDGFYSRLLSESRATPKRARIDAGEVGDNTKFWKDVQQAFVDDSYPIPEIPVDDECFIDKNSADSTVYNIQKCWSKWVTSGNLRSWYNDTHDNLTTYIEDFDRSGGHDFSFDDMEVLLSNYVKGAPNVTFLLKLAGWRGDEARLSKWFRDDFPDHVPKVDGMHLIPAVKPIPKTVHTARSTVGSFGGAVDRLVEAFKSSSAERRRYYSARAIGEAARAKHEEARAKQEEARPKHEDETRKRDRALDMACDLRKTAAVWESEHGISTRYAKTAKKMKKAARNIELMYYDQVVKEFLGCSLEEIRLDNDDSDDNDE